jgi:predicted TIM-barrel fold metal-dependent hydrolase
MLTDDTLIISVDDHIVEPPHLWQDRLSTAQKEQGPRVVEDEDGHELWLYEGRTYEQGLLAAVMGRPYSEWNRGPLRYGDILPGCFDPQARLADMDRDGVAASINFPSFPRLAGTLFLESRDYDLGLACVRAWNDFMIDEWCAAAPDRYVPLALVPLWDPVLAAEEVRRVAGRGARTVSFPENPVPLGLPSFHTHHWDPFFEAVCETEMPVSLHFGSSSQVAHTSDEAPYVVVNSLMGCNAMSCTAEIVFSPLLHRFPTLKIVLSEGGIGWVPYLLERMDQGWERHRYYQDIDFDARPSDLFHRHFWTCTIVEHHGIDQRHEIGLDRIMLESDYPHGDSSWPETRKRASEMLANVPDHEARMIAELNARSLFRL